MSAKIETTTTGRFIDHTFQISLLSLVLIILAGFVSVFFSKELVDKTVTVNPEQRVNLESMTLERRLIGALRIDVTAQLDTSRWVIYEIQLYDDKDQLLASAIDESWYSAGRWHEGGETGTWEQEEVKGGLDVQWGDKEKQDVTIAISVLEVGPTQGRTNNLDAPVAFEVKVRDGVIDTRYLWLGFFGTATMSLLSLIAVKGTGKFKIRETVNDSDVGKRAILGGEDSLVQVMVKVSVYDATSPDPDSLYLNLWITDGMGNKIYSDPVKWYRDNEGNMTFHKDEGNIDNARTERDRGKSKFYLTLPLNYFILTRRGYYGFYVEVSSYGPVDATTLIVKENVKTLSTISATAITVDEV